MLSLTLSLLLALPNPTQAPAVAFAGQDAPKQAALSFQWPARGQAHVRYTNEAGGQAVVVEYDARWETAEEQLRITFANLEVVSVGDLKPNTAPFNQAAGQIKAMFRITPAMRVSPEGGWLGTDDPDAITTEMMESMKQANPKERKVIKKTLEMARDPLTMQILGFELTNLWRCWAGQWIGFEGAAGEVVQATVEVPGPEGSTLQARSTSTFDGTVQRNGMNCLKLKSATSYKDADVLREAQASRRSKANAGQALPPAPVGAKRVDTLEGIYTVGDLRPIVVRWNRTTATTTNAGTTTQSEAKTWQFTWPEAGRKKAPARKR